MTTDTTTKKPVLSKKEQERLDDINKRAQERALKWVSDDPNSHIAVSSSSTRDSAA